MEVTTIINLPNCAINNQYITVPLVVQPTEMKEMEAVDAMLQTFVCFFARFENPTNWFLPSMQQGANDMVSSIVLKVNKDNSDH